MDIYTAHYKYDGLDRADITVKGDVYPFNVLAPTWDMVRGLQSQRLSQWDYTVQYFSLLMKRMMDPEVIWKGQLNQVLSWANINKSITLVCFCPPDTFCHRVLAARMLEHMGRGVYRGERVLS